MRLFYRTYGAGFPIVALHGLYASSDSWVSVARKFRSGYQLILVDQRNHGRSPHSSEHSYALMSDDLLELLDELSIKQPILLGHSMGGKVAMHFSLRNPERVKGLIVEDISPLAYPQSHENTIFHQQIISILLSFPIDKHITREEAEEQLSKLIPDTFLCRFLLKNLQRDRNGKLSWRINLESLNKNLSQIMESVVNDEIIPIKIPTLLVKGANSKYIAEDDEKAIQLFFPNSVTSIITNTCHWVHNEVENQFLQNVNQYLSMLNSVD